jgi:hypothetical protein
MNTQKMRTKTLVCAAALATALATSAMAQSNVYSLNVVGYYNVPITPNQFYLVGNQLNTTNNTLGGVIPNPPPGSQFQVFANGGFTAYTFDEFDLAWVPNPNASLAPGQGGYFKSPVATTVTFVGEVPQGHLVNTPFIKGQIVVRASMVPQAGNPNSLKIPVEPGDQIQMFNNGFTAFTFDEFDLIWTPGDPNGPLINVGQAFFYRKAPTATQTNWIRDFTVQ